MLAIKKFLNFTSKFFFGGILPELLHDCSELLKMWKLSHYKSHGLFKPTNAAFKASRIKAKAPILILFGIEEIIMVGSHKQSQPISIPQIKNSLLNDWQSYLSIAFKASKIKA